MRRKFRNPFFRLVIILAVGGFCLLGVQLFGRYVDSIPGEVVGPTPLSWTFKSNSRLVSTTFETEGNNVAMENAAPVLPEIDLVDNGETEFALFALG